MINMVYNSLKETLSPRCFPIREETDRYIQYINEMKDRDVRMVLKIIALTGVRFSEAINSFIIYDNVKNSYHLDCYALKRSAITQFKLDRPKAVEIKRLQSDYANAIHRFKTIPFYRLFDIDFDEIRECANDIDTPRKQCRPFSSYLTKKYHTALYRALHKNSKDVYFRVYYLNSKLSGVEKEISIAPSFHFYRKLFASELLYRTKDIALTVETMKWTNLDRALDYIKKYSTKDEKMIELTRF